MAGRGPHLTVYFDACYVAKCYLTEPDSADVRKLARRATQRITSAYSVAEVACAFHRGLREGKIAPDIAAQIRSLFLKDLAEERWHLIAVDLLRLQRLFVRTETLPTGMFLRAGDAIHLISALEAGVSEIWTTDRHMTAAASFFGLRARSL